MTTFAQIRQALADAVETTGLRCDPYLVDKVNAPCAMIGRLEMSPDLVFSEATQISRLAIQVFTTRTHERSGQELLDEYLDRDGDSSIKAAIEDGDNWPTGLGVDYCKLVSWGEVGITEVAGAEYITARIEVEVCW